MKHRVLFVIIAIALYANGAAAADFETATTAVSNMKVGWNLGNTLESNSGALDNMWIEAWTDKSPSAYETAWGQPVTKRELIKMMKKAGFNAIRVPVTWYPHMEATFSGVRYNNSTQSLTPWDPQADPIGTQIDEEWMARVQEVVDYVIDEGMYCILNVHHDTGTSTTAWLTASMANYNKNKSTFEAVWTQIANRFKNYGEKLIFEGYNEMLDPYNSWCFASMGTSGQYDANVASDAYNAINSYAQSFVNAVRATGGNNAQRNLAVCTYAACSGSGTWRQYLQDPLKNMEKPTDSADGHILFEVHSYLDTDNINNCKSTVDQMLRDINTYLAPKGPVIFGEWGTSEGSVNFYEQYRSNTLEYAKYFVKRAKQYGFATFYWMGLSDGEDRSVPQFTQPDMVSSITKGYYGDSFDYTAKLLGDLNDDGTLSVTDVTLLVNLILEGGEPDYEVADINKDGSVSVTDVTLLVNIILTGGESEEEPLADEPTKAPNSPTTASSDIVLSVFSDKYGFANNGIHYPGGWYNCEVTETSIDGTSVTKAVYSEKANDTWTGQAGFWQTDGKSIAGAKRVYITAFSPDATQLTIEIMSNEGDSSKKLADIVIPLQNKKWNYLSASIEDLGLTTVGNVSVRTGHSTVWFTDLYFAK